MSQALGLLEEIFGLPAALALVVSLVIILSGRFCSCRTLESYAFAVALPLGFFAGYLLLPRDFAQLRPAEPRHWLPYLGLAALVASAIEQALPGRRIVAVLSHTALVLLAAWLVTPAWPVWSLAGLRLTPLIALYLAVLAAATFFVGRRGSRWQIAGMTAAAAGLALYGGIQVSAKLAQLAAIAAGGLAGCSIGQWFGKADDDKRVGRMVLPYIVLVGGAAVIICVEPEQPLASTLLIPFLPACVGAVLALRSIFMVKPRGAAKAE